MRELAVCCSSFLRFQIVPENSCLLAIRKHHKFPGGLTARVTPVPIPNTEVKPCRADDTARVTARERRSPPGIKIQRPQRPKRSRPFLFLRQCGDFSRNLDLWKGSGQPPYLHANRC